MKQNITRFSLVCLVFFSWISEGCGPAGEATDNSVTAADNSVAASTVYVNFGRKINDEACQGTGICDIQATDQRVFMNTTFRYIRCQRPDKTDSLSISFYPDVLKTVQDTLHFALDSDSKYEFETDYVFDSDGAIKTKIAEGTVIPAGKYATIITSQQNEINWTIAIPAVRRPSQK